MFTACVYQSGMKIKAALIALAMLLQMPLVSERAAALGLSFSLVAYIGLLIVSYGALIVAAMATWSPWRWAMAVIFASGNFLYVGYFGVMAQEMTYDAFVNIWDARDFAGDAIAQFLKEILWAWLSTGLILLGIGLPPRVQSRQRRVSIYIIPIFVISTLATIFYYRGGEGGRGLPGALVAPAYAMTHAIDRIGTVSGSRRPVRLPRTSGRIDRDIVLIIDESIAGHYLDINNPMGVYSGLAQQRQNFSIHNFGLGSSITHCSTGSNLTLRFGGTRQDYRRINATEPSIWSYAKNAGFGTVYIDAQRTGGAYQNGMNDDERQTIDRWIQFDGVAVVDRDQAVADTLAQLLNDDHAQFILVNKMGAHFPVQAKYPESRTRFRPVADRSQFDGIVEPSVRDTTSVNQLEWRLYRNAYRNVIEWNVGAFFDRLFSATVASRATIVYTSDHGQHLHENGEPGNATHCTPDPAMEEGVVPMVVIEDAGGSGFDWQGAALRNRNRTSHFRIFPTLLGLMGYESQAVRNFYGSRMDASHQDRLAFNTMFNARLGRDPSWKEIYPAQLNILRRDYDVPANGAATAP